MQFQVPQFIDIEDGSSALTLKQFLYLAAAAAFSFILFFMLQLALGGSHRNLRHYRRWLRLY